MYLGTVVILLCAGTTFTSLVAFGQVVTEVGAASAAAADTLPLICRTRLLTLTCVKVWRTEQRGGVSAIDGIGMSFMS